MGYRDEKHALEEYRKRLAGEIEEARIAAREAAERASRAEQLEKELAETDRLLSQMGSRARKLPMLDAVRIASPCNASWDAMVGDDRVRFCGECKKNVYNLSAMSGQEAESLLAEREGDICARLYRRADGTVITSDCPVGVRRKRVRRLAIAAVGGGLMAAASALGLRAGARQGSVEPLRVDIPQLGEVATGVTTVAEPAETGKVVPFMGNVSVPSPPPPRQVMGRLRPTTGVVPARTDRH
jgi:hypothetical protein